MLYIPSASDWWVLALSLALLVGCWAYTARALPNGAVNLLTIALSLLFVQYSLSAWLVLLAGAWEDWLLSASHVGEGIRFVFVCSVFLAGGFLTGRRSGGASWGEMIARFRALVGRRQASLGYLGLWCALLALVASIASIGSLEEFWRSPHGRGFGQFDQSASARLGGLLIILSSLFGAVAVCAFGAYYATRSRRQQVVLLPLLLVVLLLASNNFLWGFSRVAGAFFILMTLLLGMLKGPGGGVPLLKSALLVTGLYLCVIGLTHRGFYNPGLAPFAEAVFHPRAEGFDALREVSRAGTRLIGPATNFFDAMGPFSVAVEAASTAAGYNPVRAVVKLLLILQPLPSGLFPPGFFTVSSDLRQYLGVGESMGITTPALAELYILFGWAAPVVSFALGRFLRWADRMLVTRPRPQVILGYVLIIAALVVAGHSGLRAFARPFVIGAALIYLSGYRFALRAGRGVPPVPGQAAAGARGTA